MLSGSHTLRIRTYIHRALLSMLVLCASIGWADTGFERRDVKFKSAGINLAAWLYVPKGAGEKRPAIVMAHGYSLPKEAYLDVLAEPFAKAGFVVLVFDYRYLGASEGEPRQQVFPHAQIEDYRNAITWLGQQKEVDGARIGVWGVSFSGGHVLYLGAFDKRVKAVAALIPFVDGMHGYLMRTVRSDLLPELHARLSADRAQRYVSGKSQSMPVVGEEGQAVLIPGKEAHAWFSAVPKVAPLWKNMVTLESVEKLMEYQPAASIHLISPTPLLMVVATQDTTTPTDMQLAAFQRALEPKTLVMYRGSHFAGENEQEDAKFVEPVVRWFMQNLMKP